MHKKGYTLDQIADVAETNVAAVDASAIPPLLRLMNFLNKIAQARNILSYSKTDCKKIFCFWKIILHIF